MTQVSSLSLGSSSETDAPSVATPTVTPAASSGAISLAVLVLGMHRSGTSMLSRLLALLGVDLGTDLLPATAANETGFWEHRDAVTLHDDIYQRFGHDWKSVSPLPLAWWEQDRLEPYRARLRDWVQRDFGASALWGVKDPRLCDMLPLWREVLSDLKVRPLCVLIVRNPMEVAQSLERQHMMPPARAHLLWLRSLLNAERYSRGLPRVLVSYEAILADWQSEARRIGSELRVEWPNSIESAAPAVEEFIRPQLRHFSIDDTRLLKDTVVPELVRRVYQRALQALHDPDLGELSNFFDDVTRELNVAPGIWSNFIADLDTERQTAERMAHQLAIVHSEATSLRQQLAESSAALDNQRVLVEQTTQTAREQQEELDRLHRDIGRQIVGRKKRMESRRASKPTVVVIIPFYNGSSFIERALQSVFDQSVPPDEVIVVNDGSRAEERAALGELAGRFPFRIVDKENGGQGSARNAGVDASTADYICFLDQDDFYLWEHVEILTKGIPPHDARFGWVYADLLEANGDGNVVRNSMVKEHSAHPKRSVIELLGCDLFVLPSASLISRKAYLAVGGFDPQFVGYEDDDLFVRLFRNGFSNYFVDKPVTVWCIHVNSASYSIRMSQSRFLYFKKLGEQFPDEPEKTRYYFRDCLMPRFGTRFFKDAVMAARESHPNRDKFNAILSDYADIVAQNPSVPWSRKKKMRLAVDFISSASPWMIKTAESLSTFPLLSRIGWTA